MPAIRQHSVTPVDDEARPVSNTGTRILELAIPCPLHRVFDYLLPESAHDIDIQPGMRVRAPFGRQSVIAIVIREKDSSTLATSKLKAIETILDTCNLLGDDLFALLQWSARYYNHPVGDVFNTALPAWLRSRDDATPELTTAWRLTSEGSRQYEDGSIAESLKRAQKQLQLIRLLAENSDRESGLLAERFNELTENWRPAMKALEQKRLVERFTVPAVFQGRQRAESVFPLNAAQQAIADDIRAAHPEGGNHAVHLIDGITGSGKTEVYLELCIEQLRQGRQILVLVPEIGLTPQLTRRFLDRLDATIAILHSGMNDTQRYAAWHAAANAQAQVVIGTRSCVFTPMPGLGLIIIDEEHDGSFKQQDGFRYNARDLAIVRASRRNIPVILGSATPSLESLNNVRQQRYIGHHLRQRANNRPLPSLQLINLCSQKMFEGIADSMLDRIKQHLDADGQVLLFINRRGYAPLLMCHECGWTTRCLRCDANMTYHRKRHQLHCHHCGAQRRAPETCEDCGSSDVVAVGAGTERVEQFLQTKFGDTDIIRIDRDSTRRKGSLEEHLERARQSGRGILVGTQMLAKGHDFPNITLVGILDADQALFSADYRATENLAQLIIQVAGRAGRAERSGEVLIQTHHPEHPLLQQLLKSGYDAFAEAALVEREQAGMPPFQHLAMVRCESVQASSAIAFLNQCRQLSETPEVSGIVQQIAIYGPLTAPMERRAGRYRYQLMLQGSDRRPLHRFLNWWVPQLGSLSGARKVRWSIDIDPYDTY